MIGQSLLSVPEASLSSLKENQLSVPIGSKNITELKARIKLKRNTSSLTVGQLVLIKDNNLPPLKWKLGHVLSLTSGKDGISRDAVAKTVDGLITRTVVRLCPLPVET